MQGRAANAAVYGAPAHTLRYKGLAKAWAKGSNAPAKIIKFHVVVLVRIDLSKLTAATLPLTPASVGHVLMMSVPEKRRRDPTISTAVAK
jgi:hypothetical protein